MRRYWIGVAMTLGVVAAPLAWMASGGVSSGTRAGVGTCVVVTVPLTPETVTVCTPSAAPTVER